MKHERQDDDMIPQVPGKRAKRLPAHSSTYPFGPLSCCKTRQAWDMGHVPILQHDSHPSTTGNSTSRLEGLSDCV